MSRPSPRLSILIVTHNSADVLAACLESIQANQPSCAWEAIAVDNASTDGTVELLTTRFPWVTLVDKGANDGFAAGNMRAASAADGELLLLLNPDTVVYPGALDRLVEGLLARDDVWVAGACLLTEDGAFNTTWSDLPTLGWALSITAPWGRMGLRVRSRARMGMGCAGMERPTSVGSVSGAAFLVRRSAWEALGGLSTEYFMYFEETELCKRVHESGGDVIVVPDARVMHLEGASVGAASTRQRVWFTQSLLRYFRRNESGLAAWLLAAWVGAVNLALLLSSYPVGLASAHAREARPRYRALVRTALGRTIRAEAV